MGGTSILRGACGWMAVAAWLLAAPALAQQVSVDRFTPALDAEGFIAVQGTRTPGSERYTLSLTTDYASNLLEVELADGSRASVIGHRVESQLGAQLGLGSRFAVAATAPLIWYQSGDSLSSDEGELPPFALGDPALLVRYRFLGDAADGMGDRRDGPGIALQLGALLPVAAEDALAGEDMVRLRAELLADFHVLGAGVGASVGVVHRFEEHTLFDVRLRDELTFGLGLRAPVPSLHPLSAVLELRGVVDFEQEAALEGELGLRAPLGDFTLGVSGGAGFTGGLGTPGARAVLSLWYAPQEADADGDGVGDDADEYPPLPEDLDGFQDHDGCPDPANDNDLVPDVDDLCPNEEALEDQDDDEDGCTDA